MCSKDPFLGSTERVELQALWAAAEFAIRASI